MTYSIWYLGCGWYDFGEVQQPGNVLQLGCHYLRTWRRAVELARLFGGVGNRYVIKGG